MSSTFVMGTATVLVGTRFGQSSPKCTVPLVATAASKADGVHDISVVLAPGAALAKTAMDGGPIGTAAASLVPTTMRSPSQRRPRTHPRTVAGRPQPRRG